MFRTTLSVFSTILLLVLLGIVGFALFGLAGPDTMVAEAEQAYEAGNFSRSIRLLRRAEDSLSPKSPPHLRRQILDLRFRAHLKLGNLMPALDDIASLRRLAPDDLDLAREEIRWTIAAGRTERGIELGEDLLRREPDEPQALELAGEACQARYQELFSAIRTELAHELDRDAARAAFAALRSWLYREDGDPAAALGRAEFDGILAGSRPTLSASGSLNVPLLEIRGLIRRALSHYRAALEAGGEPVGAYLGLAYALEQGGRSDDLAMLAEIYLSRFDHRFAVEAATDLAELHVRKGRHRAAVEVADRFLPPGSFWDRVQTERIDSAVQHLLLAKARALHALNDQQGLRQLGSEVAEMQESGAVDLEPEVHMIRAYAQAAAGVPAEANRFVGAYLGLLGTEPPTDENRDAQKEALRLRLRLATENGWAPARLEQIYARWIFLEPRSADAFVRRGRLRLAQGDVEGARVDARQARKLAAHDEEVLRFQVEAIDALHALSQRGSDIQLGLCMELGVVPPDIDDHQLLPLAANALKADRPDLALICATRAAQVFNWARWPRYLQAEAAFALGRPELAKGAAESLLAYHPRDLQGLVILRRARRLGGEPTADLSFDLILAGAQDAEVAGHLLQKSIERRNIKLAASFAGTVERTYPDDPRALLLCADVQLATHGVAAAQKTLLRACNLTKTTDPELFATASRRYFLLTTTTGSPPEIQALFEHTLRLSRGDAQALYTLAQGLQQLGRPQLAYHMLLPILTEDEHAANRTGAHHLLGGVLALALGQRGIAEKHLRAALSFEDGQDASRPLTLYLLHEGRAAEAADTWWETEARDLTSAALHARSGRPALARAWAEATLADSPIHVPALCLRTLFDPAFKDAPAPLRALCAADSELLLDVLTFLEAEGFEAAGLELAKKLHAAAPDNPYSTYLLMHGYALAGKDNEALALLSDLIKTLDDDKRSFVPAFDEAVALLRRPQNLARFAPLVSELTDPELQTAGVATPRMLELATRAAAVVMLIHDGNRDKAFETLSDVWLQHPKETGIGLTEVRLAAALQKLPLAIDLCLAVEPHVPAHQRAAWLGLYFSLVTESLAKEPDPKLLARAVQKAKQILEDEGAWGIVAHFLIDAELASESPDPARSARRDPEQIARLGDLLMQHVAMFTSGKDNNIAMMTRTLQRLAASEGRAKTLRTCEDLLRRDPSVIEFWLLRARWLDQDGRQEDAAASLRWLYHYAPDHPAVLTAVERAARDGIADERDEQALSSYPDQASLESGDGKLTAGLLALRGARYDEAATLLAEAAPRPDGSPLFYRALVSLVLGQAELARELLAELHTEYPDGPFAANAAHFARQLAHGTEPGAPGAEVDDPPPPEENAAPPEENAAGGSEKNAAADPEVNRGAGPK